MYYNFIFYFPSLGGARLTRPLLGLRRGNGKAMSVAAHHIIIKILPGALLHCVFLFTLVISKTFYLLKNYFPLFICCDPTPDSKQYLINSSSVNTLSADDYIYSRCILNAYFTATWLAVKLSVPP